MTHARNSDGKVRGADRAGSRCLTEIGCGRTARARIFKASAEHSRRVGYAELDRSGTRRPRQAEKRGCHRCRCNGCSPTQDTTAVLILKRLTGLLGRRTADASSKGACLHAGSARGVMMKVGDGDLHAERKQRQPKQPQTESRTGHRFPIASAAQKSASLVSQSWQRQFSG